MSSSRVFAIFLLFAVSGSVLVFVGIHWIIDFHAISATSDPSSYMVLLLSLATLSLATLYAIHYGARRLLIWAMARRHIPTIRFFQRVAPRFTRKVLESLLGTSIVLSSAVAANAAPVTPLENHASVESAEKNVDPQRSEPKQRSVPNAQWFPEQVSVPMNNLISQTPLPKREPAKSGAEVVVAEGETLWSISAKRLGAQATAEEISTYWPQIYKANEQVIGPDPDHLEIGTVLELPPTR